MNNKVSSATLVWDDGMRSQMSRGGLVWTNPNANDFGNKYENALDSQMFNNNTPPTKPPNVGGGRPRGKVHVGPKGGRYMIKGERKVYI